MTRRNLPPEVFALRQDQLEHPERHMKACNRCGAEKPLTAFYVCHATADGRQARCKKCDNATRADRGQDGPGRPPRTGKCCSACEGMPWRRPRKGLCRCGEAFAPEPPVSVDDAAARRDYGRVVW